MSNDPLSKRVITPMSESMVAAINDFRFETRCESQAEAVRVLVERSLALWCGEKIAPQTSESADANSMQAAPTKVTNTHTSKAKMRYASIASEGETDD